MALRQILPLTHPLLGKPSAPVDLSAGVPDAVKVLAFDMLETSRAVQGAGMAAVQVGEPIRMFVMDLVGARVPGDTIIFINPEITWRSEGTITRMEGCLSMPGTALDIDRPAEATVSYTDITGAQRTYEATGFAAQCVQHEIDHLDGIRMVDHLSPLKRKMVVERFEKRRRSSFR